MLMRVLGPIQTLNGHHLYEGQSGNVHHKNFFRKLAEYFGILYILQFLKLKKMINRFQTSIFSRMSNSHEGITDVKWQKSALHKLYWRAGCQGLTIETQGDENVQYLDYGRYYKTICTCENEQNYILQKVNLPQTNYISVISTPLPFPHQNSVGMDVEQLSYTLMMV